MNNDRCTKCERNLRFVGQWVVCDKCEIRYNKSDWLVYNITNDIIKTKKYKDCTKELGL